METHIQEMATANFAKSHAWLVNKTLCMKSSKSSFEITGNHKIEVNQGKSKQLTCYRWSPPDDKAHHNGGQQEHFQLQYFTIN